MVRYIRETSISNRFEPFTFNRPLWGLWTVYFTFMCSTFHFRRRSLWGISTVHFYSIWAVHFQRSFTDFRQLTAFWPPSFTQREKLDFKTVHFHLDPNCGFSEEMESLILYQGLDSLSRTTNSLRASQLI